MSLYRVSIGSILYRSNSESIYIDSIYIYYICNIPRLRTVEAVEGFNLDYRVGPGSEVGYIAPYISTIDSR